MESGEVGASNGHFGETLSFHVCMVSTPMPYLLCGENLASTVFRTPSALLTAIFLCLGQYSYVLLPLLLQAL